MLKQKILLTQALSDHIVELRKVKGSNANEIAEKIGKSTGWVSLIQNNKLSTVNSEDLINLFSFLLSVSNQEAEHYIENYLNEQKKIIKEQGIIFYDANDEEFTQEGFQKLLDNVNEIFQYAFKENAKFTFHALGDLMYNLRFDIGFMFGLNRIPFYKLEEADIEIRKKMFKEISEIARKYIKEYDSKSKDSSED